MTKKKWKSPLLFAVAIIGGVIYHDYLSPGPGYCWSKNTRLSDDELIEIAVQDEINKGRLKVDENNPSAKHFIATHPKCCTVYRTGRTTLFEKFKRSANGVTETDLSVYFIFEANDYHPQTKKPFSNKFIGEYVDMDACGKIVEKSVMGRRSLEIE